MKSKILFFCLFSIILAEKTETNTEEKREANLSLALIITLILLFFDRFLHSKIIQFQEKFPALNFIQPSLITLTVGILAGLCLHLFKLQAVGSTIKQIFEPIFMIVLLPPILYSSVLTMEKYYFFKNIGCILLYALLGTLIAILLHCFLLFFYQLTGIFIPLTLGQCFVFSVMISATDPVSVLAIFKGQNADKNLYSLIYGESILNDAVALAIFHSITNQKGQDGAETVLYTIKNFLILALSSVLIGSLLGILASVILRWINQKNFKIFKTVIQSKEFKDYLNENDVDQNKDDSILVNSFFANQKRKSEEKQLKQEIEQSDNENLSSKQEIPQEDKLNQSNAEIFSSKKNLDDNIKTEITILIISPLLSYLIAQVFQKEFRMFWYCFYIIMWNYYMQFFQDINKYYIIQCGLKNVFYNC